MISSFSNTLSSLLVNLVSITILLFGNNKVNFIELSEVISIEHASKGRDEICFDNNVNSFFIIASLTAYCDLILFNSLLKAFVMLVMFEIYKSGRLLSHLLKSIMLSRVALVFDFIGKIIFSIE